MELIFLPSFVAIATYLKSLQLPQRCKIVRCSQFEVAVEVPTPPDTAFTRLAQVPGEFRLEIVQRNAFGVGGTWREARAPAPRGCRNVVRLTPLPRGRSLLTLAVENYDAQE